MVVTDKIFLFDFFRTLIVFMVFFLFFLKLYSSESKSSDTNSEKENIKNSDNISDGDSDDNSTKSWWKKLLKYILMAIFGFGTFVLILLIIDYSFYQQNVEDFNAFQNDMQEYFRLADAVELSEDAFNEYNNMARINNLWVDRFPDPQDTYQVIATLSDWASDKETQAAWKLVKQRIFELKAAS